LGFGVWGLGCRVSGEGFRYMVEGRPGLRVEGGTIAGGEAVLDDVLVLGLVNRAGRVHHALHARERERVRQRLFLPAQKTRARESTPFSANRPKRERESQRLGNESACVNAFFCQREIAPRVRRQYVRLIDFCITQLYD